MSSISGLFASDILVKILAIFLLNPDQKYYQAEIHTRVGGALRNVQKMLLKLEKSGLINHFKRGKMSYYHANREHPAFEDFKHLFLKTISIGDVIRDALQEVADKVELAFIFGSYAKGQEASHSDIDVFILGDLSLREIAEAMGAVTDATQREVNPVVYSREEFQKRYESHNHFILELLSCHKIWLLGNEDDLKSVVS